MHRLLVLAILSTPAFADPAPPALLGTMRGIDPVLVGAFGGGHAHAVGAPYGWFLGADAGWAWLLGGTDTAVRSTSGDRTDSWCFGARAGYQLASGLAVQARFDRLGVTAPDGSGTLMTASLGVRYSVPIVPMPFAEAAIGPAFHGSNVSPSAALGVGVSLLVARHLAFDASLRDWLVDIDGVHNVPTLMLGITAGFGG
jgi:hypothetical protein